MSDSITSSIVKLTPGNSGKNCQFEFFQLTKMIETTLIITVCLYNASLYTNTYTKDTQHLWFRQESYFWRHQTTHHCAAWQKGGSAHGLVSRAVNTQRGRSGIQGEGWLMCWWCELDMWFVEVVTLARKVVGFSFHSSSTNYLHQDEESEHVFWGGRGAEGTSGAEWTLQVSLYTRSAAILHEFWSMPEGRVLHEWSTQVPISKLTFFFNGSVGIHMSDKSNNKQNSIQILLV